jgi:starch phosphorylase
VLDGWWCEGYNGSNGWAIGAEIDNSTTESQKVDAVVLTNCSRTTVPLYYAKPDGNPSRVAAIDARIDRATPVFNTQRMVRNTPNNSTFPARAYENFARDGCGAATQLSQWKRRCARIGRWSRFPMQSNKDRQRSSW